MMNTRWFWLLQLACGKASEERREVREDLAALDKHISVPDILNDVRWTAHTLGTNSRFAPGPTDLELLAWFPVPDAERASVIAVLGAPEGEETVSIPVALAAALPDALTTRREGDWVLLSGTRWPATAFETLSWRANFALWAPGGLVVMLHTQ